jgi:SP family sugar:H+ symporter-like MFS transporter
LASAPLADTYGRRPTISFSAFFYIVGVIIEITSEDVWAQFAMGRFAAGLGIGALSTVVPMYQSESIPKRIRGAAVSSYQLFITLGIWTAYMVNFGTVAAYKNSAQWRIPNGLSALWAILLGTTILLLPESPRFAYRMGRTDEARINMARLNGIDPNSAFIDSEIREIQEKLEAETAGGKHPWHEVFTGPRMLYRVLLAMVLQAGQQLTGANYFVSDYISHFYPETRVDMNTVLLRNHHLSGDRSRELICHFYHPRYCQRCCHCRRSVDCSECRPPEGHDGWCRMDGNVPVHLRVRRSLHA